MEEINNTYIPAEIDNTNPEVVHKTTVDAQENHEEVISKAAKIIRDIQEEAIKKLPMFMRVNFILNSISRNIGTSDTLEDIEGRIDWDTVNKILHYPIDSDDYNIIPDKVTSLQQLYDLRSCINAGSADISPWQSHVCKSCGMKYYIYWGEVCFYKNRGFALPKRCKNCRDFRRQERQRASADKS